MKPSKAVKDSAKTWRKTRVQGLYQHRNGGFYSRTFHNGREKWIALETEVQSIAEQKHADVRGSVRKMRKTVREAYTGNLTFAVACAEAMAKPPKGKKARKASTDHYREQVLRSILRDWPDLGSRPLKSILPSECEQWAAKHRKRASSTRYNAAITLMRSAFEYGIKQSVILNNPMEEVGRVKVDPKRPVLPSTEQFSAILTVIKAAGGRFSRAAADFVAGLAFTGMRLDEAGNLQWQDVDFKKGEITVRGDEITGTKNGEIRTVPMIADAERLLREMKSDYPDTTPETAVFRVREAQKALDRAAEKVGASRLTHHDLRHLFATRCIESGVDIPTVSRWLGHKDGGALAMRTYGHLRDEHSRAAARKVSFAPVVPEKIIPMSQAKEAV